MKITAGILTILFLVFGGVQYNDPDGWQWMILYGYIAVMCGMAAAGNFRSSLLYAGLGACAYWAITLVPDFIAWLQMGTPNIASEMKTEQPHIELVREFLGLVICVAAFIWLLGRAKKFS